MDGAGSAEVGDDAEVSVLGGAVVVAGAGFWLDGSALPPPPPLGCSDCAAAGETSPTNASGSASSARATSSD